MVQSGCADEDVGIRDELAATSQPATDTSEALHNAAIERKNEAYPIPSGARAEKSSTARGFPFK